MSAGAPHQTPLGELTALPDPLAGGEGARCLYMSKNSANGRHHSKCHIWHGSIYIGTGSQNLMWVYSAVLSGNAPEVKFESGPKLNFKYKLCSLLRHKPKPEQALYSFNYVSLHYFMR